MGIKSKFYYYPSNFNLEEFSTTNNLPINKVAGILNLFILKPKRYSDQREISLSAKLLKKNFGDIYSKIINCLIVNGVIENTFGYSEGVSRKFQLSDYYQYSDSVKKHLKTTDNLNLSLTKLNEDRILMKYLEELKFPKIKRVSKIPNYLFNDWYSPLVKWLSDGKLTIDDVKALKILEINNIKSFEPNKYLEYLAMIDIFKEKDFNLKSDKNFRFYSSLTNLPKIFRGCLLYNGKKLAGTDVSNTQPLFLGTLCDRLFLKELRAKKNIEVDDILFNEFIVHLESNPKDLIQFNKLVQTGNLYESFTDIAPGFTREIIKDNLIKVINDKGIDKNKYKVAIRRALNDAFLLFLFC